MTAGHTPRVKFGVDAGGALEARPACTCGWVSDDAFDRSDPRGVDLALDSWSEAHDGWAQAVVLPESMRPPKRVAAIVSLSRREPALPKPLIEVRKYGHTAALHEAMCVRCGELLLYNLAAGYMAHDDPAADLTCPDPWPGPARTADDEPQDSDDQPGADQQEPTQTGSSEGGRDG